MLKNETCLPKTKSVVSEQSGIDVVLSSKQVLSLYKKSETSGIPFDTIKEVYERGYRNRASEQEAFNRVNSFISGGLASNIDKDLFENTEAHSKNSNDSSNRFAGTTSLVNNYKNATPGQTIQTIKRVVKEKQKNK